MTELKFTKRKDGKYVAHATVTEVCALHIERERPAVLEINQSHVEGGKYSYVEAAVGKVFPAIVDAAFKDEIYPVYLEIVSDSKVLSAQIIYSDDE